MDLLREYAQKLVTINADLLSLIDSIDKANVIDLGRTAWLLDRSELIREPLTTVINRASGLQEQSPVSGLTEEELDLRRVEAEVHIHHMNRLVGELRTVIDRKKSMDKVARLRKSTGLSGMKGGPLRPN